MTFDHEAMRARVSAYFDGELAPDDEPAVIEHLATCASCQDLLGDAVGLHAASRRHAPAPPIPLPVRGRRGVYGAAVASALAAAATLALVLGRRPDEPHPAPAPPPELALAATRAVEVRFSAPPFARHRPYEVVRGGERGEPIALAALAALEQRHDDAALAAALASSDQLARADQLATAGPDSPAAWSDRAAIALLRGDAERALALADRALQLGAPGAAWNRALALRELELPLAAASAFDRAAALGDDWADEARTRAARLRADDRDRRAAIADVIARGKRMVDGGPVLTAADVATSRAWTWGAFLDAVRVAPDDRALDALAPLARALDDQAPPDARTAVAMLAAARAPRSPARAALAARYRALVVGGDRARAEDLARDLDAAGPAVDDLAVGLAILTAPDDRRLARLAPRLAHATDPWFRRVLALERVADARPRDPARAEAIAREALVGCAPDGGDYRCARLAYALADLLVDRGALEEAAALAARAVAELHRAGEPSWEDYARQLATELFRVRGAWSRARGAAEETLARVAPDARCEIARDARMAIAEVARYQGDLEAARAQLPAPDACGAVPPQHLITVAYLALQSGRDDDRALGERWLAAARAGGTPDAVVAIARGIVDGVRAPTVARAALDAALATPTLEPAPRTLAFRALARAEAVAGDWAAVVTDAEREIARPPTDACVLAISPDDLDWVFAARTAAGSVGARVEIANADAQPVLPSAVATALAGCARVEVLARPPAHGRASLLPPALAWAFVGARPAAPPRALGEPRAVVFADPDPPIAELRAPRLGGAAASGLVRVTGAAATPARALAELATATFVELDAHGIANLAEPGTSFLALSPDARGAWRLTAAEVARARFAAAPIVVLGACRAAATTPRWDARWSLPDAFLAAGARAVIAADADLPDAEAAAWFARVRERLARGEEPAHAVAVERAAAIARGEGWAAHVIVFE